MVLNMNMVWGFGFSLVVGGIVAWLIMDKWLYPRIKEEFTRPDILLVAILGAMERFMYTSSIILNVPYWIAIWPAFKALTRWRHAEGDKPRLSVRLGNMYCIGNLLTILFGVIGGLICKYGFDIENWCILFK